MKVRNLAVTFAALVPLVGLGGCLASSGGSGVTKVNDLMTWIERVHVEAELSKQRMQAVHDVMGSLLAGTFKTDTKTAFEEFLRVIQASEEQEQKLRSTMQAMTEASHGVFDQWSADLLKISNPQMRRRSESRLEATRLRFQAIAGASKTAETGYASFNQGTRDLALFLNNDLNPAAVADVRSDAHVLAELATELDKRFDRCLDAAREYLATAGPGAEPDEMPPAPSRR